VLQQVGEAGYLGPGCVVTATSPATLRSRQPVTAAVVTAAVAVAGASTVTTRLPIETRTVIVALETADDPDEALAGLSSDSTAANAPARRRPSLCPGRGARIVRCRSLRGAAVS
jgi:hypothetical protein